MKGWKVFAEIKELKRKGFNKSQVERLMNINYKTVTKYWDIEPEEYARLLEESKHREKKLDKYRSDILSWIREFNDISTAQISDWLREKYEGLDFKERTLRDYVKRLRKDFNLPKAARERQYIEVPEMPMGYQAQVDFGQCLLHKPDGSRVKLYCFAMVLSLGSSMYTGWISRLLQ